MDEFKLNQAKIVQELEHREFQLERNEKRVRTFESDLYRREKQLTDLILKNDGFSKALSDQQFSPEDTDILSNLLPASSKASHGGIDFDKSGGNYFENRSASRG